MKQTQFLEFFEVLVIGLLIVFLVIFLTGCGEAKLFKKAEYLIEGQWKQCSFGGETACGQTLQCGKELYQCMNNVQMRAR